eukprot:11187543-Lingulodinium_polyedra.AAC.1
MGPSPRPGGLAGNAMANSCSERPMATGTKTRGATVSNSGRGYRMVTAPSTMSATTRAELSGHSGATPARPGPDATGPYTKPTREALAR